MELICTNSYGFRRVNNREAAALIFTYGVEVGKFLIDTIAIDYHPDPPSSMRWLIGDKKAYVRPGTKSKIQMRSDYNPGNLKWLGIFIHESAHIWQAHTWRHIRVGLTLQWKFWRIFRQSYDYNDEQLVDTNFGLEQFPSAVQDWFYVKYGIESCLIDKKNQVDSDWVWDRIIDVLGEEYESERSEGLPRLEELVDEFYEALTIEIRRAGYLR